MEWTDLVAIISVNVALAGMIIGFMAWAFNKLDSDIKALGTRLDTDIKSLGTRLDSDIKSLGTRLDQFQITLNDLDKRLYGIEAILHMKDCCVLKQDQNLKKAQ